MTINEFLPLIDGVKEIDGGYSARCPAHDDQKNSLSVKSVDDRILLYCHAGCETDSVCETLGLTTKDLFNNYDNFWSEPINSLPRSTNQPVEVYDYCDENGRLLYQNCRYEPKTFRQRKPDGQGDYVYKLNGTRRVPFQLPKLISALNHNPERELILCEGEKDALNLEALGFTTSSFKNWRPEFNQFIENVNVVLMRDHDKAGVKLAEDAAKIINQGKPRTLKVVDVFAHLELPDKGGSDISDWLTDGRAPEVLSEIIDNTPLWMPTLNVDKNSNSQHEVSRKPVDETPLRIICLKDVSPKPVDWLRFPYFPQGKITMISGQEGLGKSQFTCQLAACVSTGLGLPPDFEHSEPGNVLMLSAEDGLADTIRPRLEASEADLSRIFTPHESLTFDDVGLRRLELYIAETESVLVTIDPIFAYTPARVDINRSNESRAISARLAVIAEKFNVAIVLVRHIGKSKGQGDARAAGLGSIDWRAAVRSELLIGCDPNDERRRAIVHTKSNLSPLGASLGFVIENTAEGARFQWTGISQLTAGAILALPDKESEKFEQTEAVAFLNDALGDGEEHEQREIAQEAQKMGITLKQLQTARHRLGVNWRREGFGKGSRILWRLVTNDEPTDF